MTKLTDYFLPVLKETPAGAEVASHKLMLRAGMIRQQNAGIYVWLPLGLRVLKKIENIIREEMNRTGALEVLMPCIQPADLWRESGRYDSYGKEMLRIKDRHEHELLFGPTNEEVINDVFKNNIKSYKEMPKNFYQMQWKFRDEIRPRFGLMRGREFYMKDAYSFDVDEESARASYDNMFNAYLNIFKRLGLGSAIPVRADTGPIGGDLSHEFHIIANTGESDIFYDIGIEEEVAKANPDIAKLKSMYAMADDMHKPEGCHVPKEKLKRHKSIEVGHIFYYGTKYSEAMRIFFMSNDGHQTLPHGGCYGIGVSRLVAAIIEASHDEKGIIWPSSVAPFQVSLLNLNVEDSKCSEVCKELYDKLCEAGVEVLYDDSKTTAGHKFATHELIGVPLQVIVGPKLAQQNKAELKYRINGEIKQLDVWEILSSIRV